MGSSIDSADKYLWNSPGIHFPSLDLSSSINEENVKISYGSDSLRLIIPYYIRK